MGLPGSTLNCDTTFAILFLDVLSDSTLYISVIFFDSPFVFDSLYVLLIAALHCNPFECGSPW